MVTWARSAPCWSRFDGPEWRALSATSPYVFAYAVRMRTISATRAREQLYRLLDEVADSSEPVQIQGPRSDAVLVSAEDWNSIQETLYLTSIPGMRESLLEALNAPASEFSETPGWSDD